jgi:hypothetical protein
VAPWLPSRWRSSKRAAGVIDRPYNARVLHDLRLPHDEDRLAELRGTRRQGGLARRRFLAAVAEHELAPPADDRSSNGGNRCLEDFAGEAEG